MQGVSGKVVVHLDLVSIDDTTDFLHKQQAHSIHLYRLYIHQILQYNYFEVRWIAKFYRQKIHMKDKDLQSHHTK